MEERSFLQTSLKFWKKGGGIVVSSRGASKFDLVSTKSCTHWIFTHLLHKASRTHVCLFNIYVPVLFSKKILCWEILWEATNGMQLENIIIAGDLNVVLNPSEKRGDYVIIDPIREWVDEIILDWDLTDIRPSKGKFTWTNKCIGPDHIMLGMCYILCMSSSV
jgi:hypothetical protein